MAELCTAFKRIVPRYQFSTNQASFVVEDMKDRPLKKNNGGYCFRGQQTTPTLCDKCCTPTQYVSRCNKMDTCARYFHSM